MKEKVTTAPLHHCTTAPLHHCTTAPLHHCTTSFPARPGRFQTLVTLGIMLTAMILPKLQPRAEAMNFDREQLFCLYSATHDNDSGLKAITIELDSDQEFPKTGVCEDFLILMAGKNANGDYQLCLQATNNPAGNSHIWQIVYAGITYTPVPNPGPGMYCFTIPAVPNDSIFILKGK